jgi:hypothetical protein
MIQGLRHTRLELRPRSTWRNTHAIRKGEATRNQVRNAQELVRKDKRWLLADRDHNFEPAHRVPVMSWPWPRNVVIGLASRKVDHFRYLEAETLNSDLLEISK